MSASVVADQMIIGRDRMRGINHGVAVQEIRHSALVEAGSESSEEVERRLRSLEWQVTALVNIVAWMAIRGGVPAEFAQDWVRACFSETDNKAVHETGKRVAEFIQLLSENRQH